MFDFADKALVWIPVTWKAVRSTDPDGMGEEVENEIEVQVEIVDRERLRELFPQDVELDPDDHAANDERELNLFLALAHNWRRVADNGSAVPFNEENAKRMLRVPMFGVSFERCYMNAWTGRVEYREKNSESSPDGGRADGERGPKAKPKAKPRS